MGALHPRLLVRNFESAARFWSAALHDLLGIEPVEVLHKAGYANWDLDGQAVLVPFSRDAIADAVGSEGLPRPGGQETAMLVLRVDDVDAATAGLAAHGAALVAEPQDRPQRSPGLRTAHLRDPEGNLIELQSY